MAASPVLYFESVHMKLTLILAVLLSAAAAITAQTTLTTQTVKLSDGRSFNVRLPQGMEMIPAAEGLKRVRFFAKAPDGRIFVTDMHDLTDNKRGSVQILDGFDENTGKFQRITPYLTGLHNPNSIAFYTDRDGTHWLYVAETHALTRRRFTLGETSPSDRHPQIVATFPDYGLSYKYGGWHLTRTVVFSPGGKLYVSVGSSCNSCVEKERVRATVLEMEPDGSGQKIFAKGLRNAVSIKWIGNSLWATNQGSDHLGTSRPDETFYELKRGMDAGWPYCHSSGGRIFPDPKLKRRSGCRGVAVPSAFFPARSSALGFDLFGGDAPQPFKNAFLVALHGSTNRSIGHGYRIVSMRPGKPPVDVITGFLEKGKVNGRPCDILRLSDDAFLFTDDNKGVVYLVRKKR